MTTRSLLIIAAILLLSIGRLFAAGDEAFTASDKAGPDFVVQGEYKGEIIIGENHAPIGLQVIAKGDGNFDVLTFVGGLPGDGWTRGDKKNPATAKTVGGVTTFKSDHAAGTLENGKITAKTDDGHAVATVEKIERKSPTLGAAPPAGAIVLFDGTSTDEFPGAKMSDDKLLMPGAISKREFTDFKLHLEFRTPFMPKSSGQGRGNSGVYLQDRYEIQVLDSFGLDGKNNECGGLYSLKEPAVNMCFPPLAWQTYDIDFTAAKFEGEKKVKDARATVLHNGVKIYDDMELPGITPGGATTEAPGRGPLKLQDHGNPVAFRNIWVVEKK